MDPSNWLFWYIRFEGNSDVGTRIAIVMTQALRMPDVSGFWIRF